MANKDDTMNLEELDALLSGVSTDGFDLDSIIAEVSGEKPREGNDTGKRFAASDVQASETQVQSKLKAPVAAQAPIKHEDKLAAEIAKSVEKAIDPSPQFVVPPQQEADVELEKDSGRSQRKKAKRAKQSQVQQEAMEAEQEKLPEPRRKRAPSKKGANAPKQTRKEARAARRAAELAEEEEEIVLRNPAQAFRAANRRAKGLSVRALLIGILFLAVAYLSVAQFYEALPLPQTLSVEAAAVVVIGIFMGVGILSIIIGIDVFGKGFGDLFSGMPSRNTLISLCMIVSVLHCAAMLVFEDAGEVTVPYMAASLLLFYAAMREERNRYKARARTYKVADTLVSADALYSHYDKYNDVCRAKRAKLNDMQDFLTEIERPDTADRFSMIYVPISLAACVVLSLLVTVARGVPVQFFGAFSALLCVSTPLGLICAFGANYNNTSRKLLKRKAAIAGARQASLLRDTEEVVLTEAEIYPHGAITVHSLKNMGKVSDDKLIAVAAAVTSAAGLEVGEVLTQVARERYNLVLQATNVQAVEGGLAGQIGGIRVILGSPSLMVKLKVPVRSGQNPDVSQMYVVMDDTLVGIVTLRYQPTKQVHKAMSTMKQMHMSATLAVRDFNISPTMVESEFGMKRGFADQPEIRSIERIRREDYTDGDAPAAILIGTGLEPMVQVLKAADKLAGAVRSNLVLGAFAGICGMLIVFYMLFQGITNVLTVTNILLYLLIWYLPSFIITLQTR